MKIYLMAIVMVGWQQQTEMGACYGRLNPPALAALAGNGTTAQCTTTLQHEFAVESCAFSVNGVPLAAVTANFNLVLWQQSTCVRRAMMPLDHRR